MSSILMSLEVSYLGNTDFLFWLFRSKYLYALLSSLFVWRFYCGADQCNIKNIYKMYLKKIRCCYGIYVRSKTQKNLWKLTTSINGTSSFVNAFKIVTHYVALDYNYFSWSKDIHVINEMKSNETIESLFTLHLITIFIFVIYFFIKKNWKYFKYRH